MTDPAQRRSRGMIRRGALTLLACLAVAAAWSQVVDRAAATDTGDTLKRALAAFAVARGMNAVISVAQGTELAVQPVGVGVTLTIGEVLDPLNDLVENFAWLALLASVSLGTQLLLADVAGNVWMNGLLTVTAAGYLVALWWPGERMLRVVLLRAFALALFARFLFALVSLTTGWVDQAVLAERQEAALARIERTQEHIEALQENPPVAGEREADDTGSVLDRLGALLGEQRQALNLRAQLDALTERVEGAIEEIINLLVVFTVQTILVPVAALFLAYRLFLGLWRWSWRSAAPP